MTRSYLKTIGLILTAATMLCGCRWVTDEADYPDAPEQEGILSRFGTDGTAWLSLQIHTGGSAATRADGTSGTTWDGLKEGKYGEYAIDWDKVYILLFAGTSEETAKFASAYKTAQVDSTSVPADVDKQITQAHTVRVYNVNIKPTDKLWAFAIVNNNDGVITSPASFSNAGEQSIGFDDGTTINTGSTLSDLKEVKAKELSNGTYYLMTNAPMSTKPGKTVSPEGGSISILAQILPEAFYGSEDEATKNPGVDIFVERNAAKVSVQANFDPGGIPVAGSSSLKIQKLEVVVDRRNTQSYLFRHVSKDSLTFNHNGDYRIVGDENLMAARDYMAPAYRTYWAEDQNYAGTSAATDLQDYDDSEWQEIYNSTEGAKSINPFYVMENTFDLCHQELECSTQLLLRAKVSNNDFYTIDITGEEFSEVANPTTDELGTSASSSFARATTRAEGDHKPLDVYLRDWLLEVVKGLNDWVNKYADGNPEVLKIKTDKKNPDDVKVTVSLPEYMSGEGKTKFEELKLPDAIEAALKKLTIKIYEGGYCYYRVPIRHFVDEQTPWELTKQMQHNTVRSIYLEGDKVPKTELTPAAMQGFNNQYLGRYGVVRNNWYNISIDNVTRIGDPTIVSLTGTDIADDNPKHFVSLKMSVLPWIQHSQPLE